MNPISRMKAPSCRGVPVLGPNTGPGVLRGANGPAYYCNTIVEAVASILAERARMGATASSILGFTSAIRAVEDLQWISTAITTLHKRIAAGAASAGPQPYLPLAGLVILGAIQFWNSKTGKEGYPTRPMSRYADQVREWAHAFEVESGKKSDMLVWQAGATGLESGKAECLVGTAYARARWHALRRGDMGACWAHKPDLAYFKWWGRWWSNAVALQYATRWI